MALPGDPVCAKGTPVVIGATFRLSCNGRRLAVLTLVCHTVRARGMARGRSSSGATVGGTLVARRNFSTTVVELGDPCAGDGRWMEVPVLVRGGVSRAGGSERGARAREV
jgi:hypothetical protein